MGWKKTRGLADGHSAHGTTWYSACGMNEIESSLAVHPQPLKWVACVWAVSMAEIRERGHV